MFVFVLDLRLVGDGIRGRGGGLMEADWRCGFSGGGHGSCVG